MAKAEILLITAEILGSEYGDLQYPTIVPVKKGSPAIPQAQYGKNTAWNGTPPEEHRRRRNFAHKTHPR